MKRLLLIFGLALSAIVGVQAQGVYSIELQPVCWNFNGVDSTLTAYWLMTAREEVPRVVSYLNPADGTKVDISGGGTVSAGYCCCNGNGGSGSGSTVVVEDNSDGTYNIIVDGDTTLVDTRANSNPVAINISVGDTTYLAGSTVQEIINAIATEVNTTRSRTGCDLKVGQSSHGFDEGDLLSQNPNTGAYYLASSDTSSNFPVAYVCQVISADSFYVDTEGWVTGTHGLTVWRDFFVQGTPGDVDTTAASKPIFAFRTFTDNLRYYDIPEYLADGGSGDGGGDDWGDQVIVSDGTLSGDGTAGDPLTVTGGSSVIASNGLNDADAGSDVDVELGGTIGKNTTVSVPSNYLSLAGNNNIFRIYPDRIRLVPNTANEATRPLGAAVRKNTAAGSDANITYTEYGLPYFAPLTFTSNYSVYYNSDKTMSWVYHPAEGNGMFMNSTVNPSGGGIERTLNYGLGGTLTQNTPVYFDTTYYLLFAKDPTVLDTTYEFSLKIDPDPTGGPTLRYISNFYDTDSTRWNDSEYFFSPDSLSFSLSNSVGEVSSNLSRLNFSRQNGLQVYFRNNLTQYIHLNAADGVKATYGGSSIQIDPDGNLLLEGVPNYANDAAADSDGTLPTGGVYTVTAEDRTLRIKP